MVRDEICRDDTLREAFETMRGGSRLETNACRFINGVECNHIGDEEGVRGCIAFLLGRLNKKLERR